MSASLKEICKGCENKCNFFKYLKIDLPDENIKMISPIRYRRKEMIIKQDSYSQNICFIKSGIVRVFCERRNDKNIILNIATPNEFVDLSNIYKDTYIISATAMSDCEICIIPKLYINNIIKNNSSFAQFLLEKLSEQNNYYVKKIQSLGTKQMHGRLADVILYVCSERFKVTSIFEHLSRKDIAELAGMSSENAIRLLTEFKNDGLIKMDGKKILINNLELITRLSEIG